MLYSEFTSTIQSVRSPAWILTYTTVDVPLAQKLAAIAKAYPGVPVFGCTSFQGVFSPLGFTRGMHALIASAEDGVRAATALRAVGSSRARTEARAAAGEIRKALRDGTHCILMHATPGFEERVLEGIEEAYSGSPPPVYGGSAADDDMSGKWQVYSGGSVLNEGFVLAGFSSPKRVMGSFVGGYTPTNTRGVVTSVLGRMVQTIDHKPAAQVYNEWTYGGIQDQLARGGVVLQATALRPVGRLVDKVGAVPRYLLSHPHQVMPDGSLWFFSEMREGDELVLMLGTEAALVERTSQVATRALGSAQGARNLSGGILVFCGGCVSAMPGKTNEVSHAFRQQLRSAPFVGASTFGEQGCFTGRNAMNRHGNLMCDAVLFEA
ncbi:MAG TPA: FIST N-terminal domain-containing protein [Polyangiaceae bacterium]|nr:FIST N-terminal domain-containing protein [Polyangiaceae bacterium]